MTGEQHSLALIKRLPVLGCLCYQRGPFISRKYPQTLRKLFCQPAGNVYGLVFKKKLWEKYIMLMTMMITDAEHRM